MKPYIYATVILSCFLLVVAFGCLISSKKLRSHRVWRWYVAYLGFILSIEAITHYTIYILESNSTQHLYPLYVAGEFFILTQLFLSNLKAPKKWMIFTGAIAMLFYTEVTYLWYVNLDFSFGYSKIISHLIIICFSGYLLLKNLKELESDNPLTIIYSTLFLYYSVSLFLFLMMDQLTVDNIVVWIINNLLASILYGSSIYTFYKLRRWRLT